MNFGSPGYRGRFAPTPSGPLHLGSLLTALASFLQARKSGGAWLLRIDDLDPQRSRREYAKIIQQQLEAHGLHWDESPRWQSQHLEEYEAAFEALRQTAETFVCACTRARLSSESRPGPDGPVYAGTCRNTPPRTSVGAWRLNIGVGTLQLHDPWQNSFARNLQSDIGDFVLRRTDGQPGYQLACVVDEAAQDITEVVRGVDLIGSSLKQIRLQQILGLAHPEYRHLPLLLDAQGHKLSKQNHAMPIDARYAVGNLHSCLKLLGQNPPENLADCDVETLIGWAVSHWRPDNIPRVSSLSAGN